MTGRFTTSPADYLAAERTFLAWIRTGLALMGFGFVVARFGLLLESLQMASRIWSCGRLASHLSFGTALVFLGHSASNASMPLPIEAISA